MKRYLPLFLIVGLLIVFRVLGSRFPEALPNFQPLAALFFCGALLATAIIFTSVFLAARIRLPKLTADVPAPAYAKSR